MAAHSLDWYYTKMDRQIRLLESYTEIKNISAIVKMCRLKPKAWAKSRRFAKVELFREWYDEYGNSLIFKKKTPSIIYGDLSIGFDERTTCTDFYYGISIPQIAKISNTIFLVAGKDEDLHKECYLVSFLGIDGYLRTYLCMYGEWKQVSSLMLGMENLCLLAENINKQYYRQLDNGKEFVVPCAVTETWICSLPVPEEFREIVKARWEGLLEIIIR